MRGWLTILLMTPALLFGQEAAQLGAKGNQLYKQGMFAGAEQSYMSALEIDPNDFRTNYNLGNALYFQEKFEDAQRQFQTAGKLAETDEDKFKAYHNLGNSFLEQDMYAESIEAYENALRIDPTDEDTRYNLAYALEKQQESENEDENEDENQDNEDREDQQDQNQENQLSEDDARRLLDAMMNEEQNVEKNEDEQQGVGAGGEKDW